MSAAKQAPAALDLLADLPDATPAAVRAARAAAGHSQAAAAQCAGLGHLMRWSEYERGARVIDSARWALYLLATGQHPGGTVKPAARRRAARPAAGGAGAGIGRGGTWPA